ncbi:hypothetical protein CRENBAI_007728 [Crenichthys baileyi]|uniref:Uncharacterized protein n=1 Tax=Crenichthys baileyi TaxID=28760 RepID=A0AAV9S104_9TELE
MEHEAAQRHESRSAGLPVPQSAYDGSRLAILCTGTAPSVPSPAHVSGAMPNELEDRLRMYGRNLKLFRRAIHLHPSPELKEKLREMEEYQTAVR